MFEASPLSARLCAVTNAASLTLDVSAVGDVPYSTRESAGSSVLQLIVALRHPLNEIAEQCERELAFPQFAGLRKAAQRGRAADAELLALEAATAADLLPGSTSAYGDLLQWRAAAQPEPVASPAA